MHFSTHIIWILSAIPLHAALSTRESQRGHLFGNSFRVPGNAFYDYVIVGGGTAGLAIAARLAEDPSIAVAVVEAGGFYEIDNGNGSVIPGLAVSQYTGTDRTDTQPLINWNFLTTSQNGATIERWNTREEKRLEGALRATTCSISDYSKRRRNATVAYNPAAFGRGGPLRVSWVNWVAPVGTWASKPMAAVGIRDNSDFNSGDLAGGALPLSTINPVNEHRSSFQISFLNEAMQKTDIKAYTQVFAQRILFENKTATGVLVSTARMKYMRTARKEVICSAGAFQSPQLLMVSGIGPRETLEHYNISVLSDLPAVGQNMWDHPIFGTSCRVNLQTSSRLINDPQYAAEAAADFLKNGTGPYDSGTAYIGWEKIIPEVHKKFTNATLSTLPTFPPDWPEIEIIIQDRVGSNNSRRGDPRDSHDYATVAIALVSQLSRGSVTISSADMDNPPVVNPNWLTHPADVEVAVAAFRRSREIWQHLSDITIGPEYLPGTNISTDAEVLHTIRQTLGTVYYAAGTCAMGKAGDLNAIVDSRARAFGVNSLRVVDASTSSLLPAGHPQSTVDMLADNIADDIKSGRQGKH
ncbi:hypothetical protein LTR66_011602 [Elasticomyces elasticus]|nr:hypothetical protein LTR66_011602 [Elasticomyces elasticus]